MSELEEVFNVSQAISAGCRTDEEIAQKTGLPVRRVRQILDQLEKERSGG
jgi:transcription initiation factor IIE alpha subunit